MMTSNRPESPPRRCGPLQSIPTTLYVEIPTDRDYARVLAQTEVIYDQLLAERRAKLELSVEDKRRQFSSKRMELVNAGETAKVSTKGTTLQGKILYICRTPKNNENRMA